MTVTRLESLRARPLSKRLQDAEEFFMKQGVVYNTLERLARRLKDEQIPYAVIGGMALNLHDYERMTRDIDVLMTAESIDRRIGNSKPQPPANDKR